MRFLCFHGMGTNSQIFEMQTAALRYELGDHHTYEFVEGTLPWSSDQAIAALFTSTEDSFAYFNVKDIPTCSKALTDLETYIETEGPFDGAIAFSQGAALLATYIIHKFRTSPAEQHMAPVFKCAIFISAGLPVDAEALLRRGEMKSVRYAEAGEVIPIPTAHIWGTGDVDWKEQSEEVKMLCKKDMAVQFVHGGGHEVPSGGALKDAVPGMVQAVRKAIHKALHLQ
ncbi:hypothetical protein EAF04_000294 [Stromatinia cepivora]|nr:hypothetical protein EAF04_000294 [Stromatinia cepivora]